MSRSHSCKCTVRPWERLREQQETETWRGSAVSEGHKKRAKGTGGRRSVSRTSPGDQPVLTWAGDAVRARFAPPFDSPGPPHSAFLAALSLVALVRSVQLCFATMKEQHPAYSYLQACFRCRELGAALARFATAETRRNVTRGLAAGAPRSLDRPRQSTRQRVTTERRQAEEAFSSAALPERRVAVLRYHGSGVARV